MLDTTYYQEKLQEQLNLITEQLKEIGIYNELNDTWEAVAEEDESAADADSNESADFTEEWDERRATLEALKQEYIDIKRALAKIASGTYGICELSGEQIEEKRLLARPDARTCIDHMDQENLLPL